MEFFSKYVEVDDGGDLCSRCDASAAEARKREHYRGLMDRYYFEPIAVETTGVLGPSTSTFLRRLGKQVSAATGDPREVAWLRERISLAVVRGNAASVCATG